MRPTAIANLALQTGFDHKSSRIVFRRDRVAYGGDMSVALAHESFGPDASNPSLLLDSEFTNQNTPPHIQISVVTDQSALLMADFPAIRGNTDTYPGRYIGQLWRLIAGLVKDACQVGTRQFLRVALFCRPTYAQVPVCQRKNGLKVLRPVRRKGVFGNQPIVSFHGTAAHSRVLHGNIPRRLPASRTATTRL